MYWMVTPASIFVGHYYQEFYCKFENMLTDSLSVVEMLKKLFFKYQNIIPNARFVIEFLEIV